MFPYDPALIEAAHAAPHCIADVLRTLAKIDAICADGDGLKWFNWLYFQVTQAVANRVAAGGFKDPVWLAELDLQFATLYFSALQAGLSEAASPGCWSTLLAVRDNTGIARI